MIAATTTTTVESRSSALVGQVAFFSSSIISPKKMRVLRNGFFMAEIWQARRESNPQPTVLETATLPIELRACDGLLDDAAEAPDSRPRRCRVRGFRDGLFRDLGDTTGTDGAATLADGELLELLHGDRGDELEVDGDVVARHDHLDAFRQRDNTGDVSRAEVELRAVTVEERRVAATFVLREDVDF